MPSHKIHLAIANKVNKELKLDNDSILLGSVLPDLSVGKKHEISHYQVDDNYEEGLANPDKFINEYKKELNNPVMIGYLIHTLTDKFYNDYFFKNHCIFDENGIPEIVKLRNGKVKSSIKQYKQSEFGKYDKWLLKNNYVVPFKDTKCIDNVIDLSVAKYDKNYLKEYIRKSNYELNKPSSYKIKSSLFYKVLSKKELDSIYENCIKYILNYLNEKNIW